MKLGLVTARSSTPTSLIFAQFCGIARTANSSLLNSNDFLRAACSSPISINFQFQKPSRSITVCSSNLPKSSHTNTNRVGKCWNADNLLEVETSEHTQGGWNVEVGNPSVPSYFPSAKLNLSDQAFFFLAFIACTTSVAFTSLVIAAVPTLHAMARAAISLSKLADTAREELPSTMAAIRLSGMEISDLTLELSDLSQEIADGVSKSAQAVQAAEAGIRQIGSLAREKTVSMIQERASLPIISLQPVVAGAAKKTSRVVDQATKTFMRVISRGDVSSEKENGNTVDRLEV
ncbi:hypothetical protein F0562_032216 [Nyssa sinensis]|uniref:Uncharacterized protein n=1 Tax=Nyssa sinensis TaxID=561372 RepID=A0A5J5AW88_9ASTE|nr:hypothetical protein F0562_032216 [Nyssa sinensis]